jgi:hypothetical protein
VQSVEETFSVMNSSDPPTVEESSSAIPLVDEDFQLNPSGITIDASGQQGIESTDERWDTMIE